MEVAGLLRRCFGSGVGFGGGFGGGISGGYEIFRAVGLEAGGGTGFRGGLGGGLRRARVGLGLGSGAGFVSDVGLGVGHGRGVGGAGVGGRAGGAFGVLKRRIGGRGFKIGSYGSGPSFLYGGGRPGVGDLDGLEV